ncbi:hypothetical protein E4U55_005316 [Claviceps digitariae]|nr:hypothetical protein E4U55_005316 [Claviceps digitariae]
MTDTDVLIVGAGPTGLVLALWLSKLNLKVRIIDKAAQAATSTRAIVVHARTLELYDQFDASLAQELCEKAHPVDAFNIWVRGRRAFRLPIADVGSKLTPRTQTRTISQHEHERMLAERLLRCYGVAVELATELLDFKQRGVETKTGAGAGAEEGEADGAGVTALVQTPGGDTQTIRAKYLAGCDGSHSLVRKKLGIAFPGGTYDHLFYVADICGSGPVMDGQVHVCLDRSDFLAVFPLPGKDGHGRLVGTMEERGADGQEDGQEDGLEDDDDDDDQDERRGKCKPRDLLTFDDVGNHAIQRMGLHVNHINSFSSYRLHHRVAGQFRHGRTFLLGDAAHIHSPVGGQGMNTGIGDAVNLAWKMAAVVQGSAHECLLDTYQEERRVFAERLVASTDRIFTMVTSKGWLARLVRTRLMPLVFRALFTPRAVKSFFFGTMSQLRLHYRGMRLSSSSSSSSSSSCSSSSWWSWSWSWSWSWLSWFAHARPPRGAVQAGDRLPWVKTADGLDDNFTSLDLRWQMHVYGTAREPLLSWCKEHRAPLMVYPFDEGCAAAGLVRDALYLVRPDGHVALVEGRARPEGVERYFAERQMRIWR